MVTKVRDGLTHPIPFGTEIEFEIIPDEETAKDNIYGARRPTGKFKYLKPDMLVEKSSVATFAQSADALQKSDAEQAVEVMLRHTIKFQDFFFNRPTPLFAYYEASENRAYTTEELLQTITRRFDNIWQAN